MSTKPILLIDSSYIAHRALHSLGNALSFDDEPTAVIYGFLEATSRFQAEFETNQIVFAFDFGHGKRREIFPSYKGSREAAHVNDTDEEKESRKKFYAQIRKLREIYLSQLGYRNVFFQEGYEADDVIASVVKYSLKEDDTAIIVSSDEDMWQLIGHNVSCYSPHTKKLMDREAFISQWGIEPALWANVKAMAGCSTDDVPGLRGIGELTVCKWYQGKVKPGTVAYRKLNVDGIEIHNRNIKLVRLPFEGCQRFELVEDEVTPEKWQALADKLGMKSLKGLQSGMPAGVKHKKSGGFGFGS